MTAEVRMQEPRVMGNRIIIPVVSDVSLCHEQGMMCSVRPLALLIGEDGKWGIVLLEGDSVVALLEKIILPV
ncbi:hypothetical protein [Methanoregula sp.]|jgi:hypothetical protein|uniref:hypothetical protein n=1 Tax=Methanoregula sp. TaxID=2052170 RepID=UPI003C2A9DB9